MTAQLRWITAGCLFGVLFFFATNNLTESPPTWFDEGIYLQASMNDALHGAQVIQLAPEKFASTAFVTGGYPFLLPIALSFKLFGIGLMQARMVMVMFIVACVAVYFALAYRMFGWQIGLASLTLLTTFPPLYGQGKNVLGEVPGLFFLGVFLVCLEELERRNFNDRILYAVAGLAAGLCLSTKPIFFLLGAAVVIAALLYRRIMTFRWDQLALSLAIFCAPIAYWFIEQFGQGDSANAILHYYANPYGISDLNAQIFTNLLRFFHESSPMYFAFLMVVWTAGIALRIWKKRDISISEAVSYIFALLVSVAFLRTAGWYRYFFVAEIPALVFLPAAIAHITTHFAAKKAVIMWAVVFFLLVIQAYQLAFGSWVAVHGGRTTTQDLSTNLQSLPKEKSYFIYNTPAAVIFVPTQNYYQYLIPNPRVDLGRDQLPLLLTGVPDYVITNTKAWSEASSTFSEYSIQKTIDGYVIAIRN